jgi:hypothetical protein
VPPVLVALTAAIRVTSATTCPTADDVAARLRPLLPASVGVAAGEGADSPTGDTLELAREGDDITARLRDGAGALLGERTLAAAHGCDELAAAIAIAAATWESDVHPEFAVATLRPTPASASVVAAAAHPVSRSAFEATLGAGLALVTDGAAAAWQAEVGGGWRPGGGATGLRARLGAQGPRTATFETGEARWRRWTASVGIERRLLEGRRGGWLAVEAAAVASLFALEGDGFAANRQVRAFDPGGYAGVRAGWGGGAAGWVAAGVTAFAAQRQAYALPSNERRDLPRWELALTLGLALTTAR